MMSSQGQAPTSGNVFALPSTRIDGARAAERQAHEDEKIFSDSDNPLVVAANPLLNLLAQIRASSSQVSPQRMRERLVEEIQRFQQRAQQASITPETIIGARYCLCTAVDEAAALTPWGGGGVWSAHSLLVTFHNETWGGEKFFQLLGRLSQLPQEHRQLIELQFYCLALGFEGRYRVIENGRAQLEALKQHLRKLLRTSGAGYDDALSPHWLDTSGRNNAPIRRRLPLWAWFFFASLIALGMFIGLRISLENYTDRAVAAIYAIRLPELQVGGGQEAEPNRLAKCLASEIHQGLLSVDEKADRSMVTIHGDGLFDSGSATVRPSYLAVLTRLARALDQVPGTVLITGYTDNQPIHRAFHSNLELSQARAESIRQMLSAALLDKSRQLIATGKGSADPVAPNTTSEGRSRNRRVEVVLLNAPPQAGPAADTMLP